MLFWVLFYENLEETVVIAEKVLKKGTLNSKVRIIKIFTQIILRIIKQNERVTGSVPVDLIISFRHPTHTRNHTIFLYPAYYDLPKELSLPVFSNPESDF